MGLQRSLCGFGEVHSQTLNFRPNKTIEAVISEKIGYNRFVMNIKELTAKMNALVAHHGWYDPDSPKKQLPRNLAISLSLEAAEVLEHYQWGDDSTDKEALAGELADVALYLLQLAHIEGIDLEQAINKTIARNWDRQWTDKEDIEK
jgi:NTP pyrophosphatase (non-canonical NTP hydrolase)